MLTEKSERISNYVDKVQLNTDLTVNDSEKGNSINEYPLYF